MTDDEVVGSVLDVVVASAVEVDVSPMVVLDDPLTDVGVVLDGALLVLGVVKELVDVDDDTAVVELEG